MWKQQNYTNQCFNASQESITWLKKILMVSMGVKKKKNPACYCLRSWNIYSVLLSKNETWTPNIFQLTLRHLSCIKFGNKAFDNIISGSLRSPNTFFAQMPSLVTFMERHNQAYQLGDEKWHKAPNNTLVKTYKASPEWVCWSAHNVKTVRPLEKVPILKASLQRIKVFVATAV